MDTVDEVQDEMTAHASGEAVRVQPGTYLLECTIHGFQMRLVVGKASSNGSPAPAPTPTSPTPTSPSPYPGY